LVQHGDPALLELLVICETILMKGTLSQCRRVVVV